LSDEFHFAQIGYCSNGLSLVLSYIAAAAGAALIKWLRPHA